jgi:hypothetical protein
VLLLRDVEVHPALPFLLALLDDQQDVLKEPQDVLTRGHGIDLGNFVFPCSASRRRASRSSRLKSIKATCSRRIGAAIRAGVFKNTGWTRSGPFQSEKRRSVAICGFQRRSTSLLSASSGPRSV